MEKIYIELFESYLGIVHGLRENEGFNDEKFTELCEVLKRCESEWQGLKKIPRVAVKILVEIVPTLDLFIIYSNNDDERKKIREATDKLKALIHEAVKSDELDNYIDSKYKTDE